ncbi:MAG: polyprenol monophosphomannose synthase [Candidatus Liptonbacteria bacterium]|nr:polyprenol monophosphomannose synthase [Candidatus Liptonbacteria bacterium]
MKEESVIAIPTYNEKGSIERLIRAIKKSHPKTRITVVDDNSPDGTAEIVETLAHAYEGITLISRPGKLGMASAYITAFKAILNDPHITRIITMDADFSHNPDDLARLSAVMEQGNDLVVGSRYVKGGKTENWSMRRRLLSKCANIYARMATGIPIADLTSGFVAYHREILERIVEKGIMSNGYAFQIEMKFLACKYGAAAAEVPIIFSERQGGVSKFGGMMILEGLLTPWRMRFLK